MPARLARRVISTSIALLVGLAVLTAPADADDARWEVSGSLQSPKTFREFGDVSPVTLRFYRATGHPDSPWTLSTTVAVAPSPGGSHFATELSLGTYRMTVNELDDGTPAWDAWKPTSWTSDHGDEFTVDGSGNVVLRAVKLESRGGRISGTLRDQCGSQIYNARFEIYDADLDGSVPSFTAEPSIDVYDYEVAALNGSTKLRISADPSISPSRTWTPSWYGGGSTFEEAQAIQITAPQVSTGHDIVLQRVLDLSGGKTQQILGVIKDPEGRGVSGLEVRYYRAAAGAVKTFVLEKVTYTQPGSETVEAGAFGAELPPGEYRVYVNEAGTGSGSSAWKPLALHSRSVLCLEAGAHVDLWDRQLAYAGGLIEGRVTDPRGAPIAGATVEAFDGSTVDAAAKPGVIAKTDAEGRYSIHGFAGPTKLRFLKTGYSEAKWFGDAPTASTADPIFVDPDGVSVGNDVTLADAQLRFKTRPGIRGNPLFGSSVTRIAGRWEPHPVKLTYRWMRRDGSRLTPIGGATSTTYKLKSADLGKRLVLRETATPIGNYPGVRPMSVDSEYSERIRRRSTAKVTAKHSSGKIRLAVRIKTAGVARPRGKVTLTAQRYRWNGRSYVRTGKSHRKTVTFTRGKAKIAFSGPKGSWGYEAIYRGSSTASEAYSEGFGFLH